MIFFILFIHKAAALDLGTYGETFVITEDDLLLLIKKNLYYYESTGKLQDFNHQYLNNIKQNIIKPPKVDNIVKCSKNNIRKFDPTVELEEEINIQNGNFYPIGYKINPLDYQDFDESLIFIDGEDQKQLMYARNYVDNHHLAKIILMNGGPGLKNLNGKEYYYYFDQYGIYTKRFQIRYVPSIVYQNVGEKSLVIREVALDENNN